ncbi:MAG: hypothetical protein J6T67_00660, partial [Paludibacteraceae bacterium]|nr:hypothetical protein [Paludibacteraceae bacterium]
AKNNSIWSDIFVLMQTIHSNDRRDDDKILREALWKDCVKKIMKKFFDNDISKEHSRHISKDEAKEVGLNIKDLEENQSLQDAVLNFHHANLIAFENTPIIKIVSNHQRTRNIEVIRQ